MRGAVPRLWPESTIVCVGSGPSLTTADCVTARAAGARMLAVNTAYQFIPDADVIFASDVQWWSWHFADVHYLPALKFALPPVDLPDVTTVEWSTGDGLDLDPARVRSGGHSGYAAVNLAYHLGAKVIILLGYDLAPDATGRHHAHTEHPNGSHPNYEYRREIYKTLLEPLADANVLLLNASRHTTIPCVPHVSLSSALTLVWPIADPSPACCQ